MHTIETTATVTEDGKLTIVVPPKVAPGAHRVVVVIEEGVTHEAHPGAHEPIALRPLPLPAWPDDATFRREEIYGDDGR